MEANSSMYVCLLEIQGFRGIQSGRIALSPHSVLLGMNNVGKSAVIDALGLVLGRDRLVRTLGDYDFFGGSPEPKSRILIKATITGFEPDDPAEHPDWFNANDGAVPSWWNGKEVLAEERPEGGRLCAQLAFAARFDTEELEAETKRYFVDGDGDPFEARDLTTVKAVHLRQIGFFLLPAHRTWDRVVSFGSDLFKKVIRFQKAIPSDSVARLRDSLRQPSVKLEEDGKISNVIGRVNNELAGFVGKDQAGLRFRPTGGDTESVLQCLTPHLNGPSGSVLPISRHGAGVVSLQTLLLLFEFGRARKEQNQNFILAAEEPELHLHPGHHRRLVARIRGGSDQSITTTHSPEIAAYYRSEEVLILRNRDGNLEAIPLLPPGSQVPDKNALMRLYTIYRTDICRALMHRVAILPEGMTEPRWLDLLFRVGITAEGWGEAERGSDASQALGVLPTQEAQIVATFEQFRPLIASLVPLVDGDKTGREYIKALCKLSNPPPLVLQLADGQCLEDVIAWIISPESEEEWVCIEEIVGSLSAANLAIVKAQLTAHKSNWKVHEDIAAYIGASAQCAGRARHFLDSLTTAAAGGDPTEWPTDPDASKGTTRVRRWSPPA